MTREASIAEAIRYMTDIYELPPGCKTEAAKMGDWIVTRHFAVKALALPRKLTSKMPNQRELRFTESLEQWQSGEHRTPVTKGKRPEHMCVVYRDSKRRKTFIQDIYAPILEGFEVVRYDGPGYQGPPLLALLDGDPVACVMPWKPGNWR